MKLLDLCKLNYKKYILEIALLFLLFFALFVPNVFTKIVIAICLLIYTFIVTKLNKKKEKTLNNKKVQLQMIIFGAIYVVAHYALGLYFGFYENPVKFSIKTILTYIIPFTVIIISSEIIRNTLISKKDKISNIITTISLVLVDIVVYSRLYDISQIDDFLIVVGLITFASISCNLLYNYVCSRFGHKSIIIYRLITILYLYVIPIIPNVYTFFRATLRILYPYIIYMFLDNLYGKKILVESHKTKVKRNIGLAVTLIFIVIVVMIISCRFYVGVLAIGSGSMTGTINKGDAVVFTKYNNQALNKGEVIVFNKNNIIIVHRIVDIIDNNNTTMYYTKGDCNENQDEGYITKADIIGISRFKIKYIGYPSLWLKDIFNHK